MTENEAIKMLEQGDKYFFEVDFTYEECLESIEMGRKALEEIQQYRAIGLTPELIEAMQGHNVALINDLGEYQLIGTVEEFKDLKNTDIPIIHGKAELDLHDKEVRNKAIDDFTEKIIVLVNEFPTVEDDWGELRPMRIEEMCNVVAEQLKGEKQ